MILRFVCGAGSGQRRHEGSACASRPSRPEDFLRGEEAALGGRPDRLLGRRLLRQHRAKAGLLPEVAGWRDGQREREMESAGRGSVWVGAFEELLSQSQGPVGQGGEVRPRSQYPLSVTERFTRFLCTLTVHLLTLRGKVWHFGKINFLEHAKLT